MADNFYVVSRNKPAGFRLGKLHEDLDGFYNAIQTERTTMIQMCNNGDTSAAANFTTLVDAYGFTDTTEAKAAFDELDSLHAKLTTDGAVSSVMSAIKQFLGRFRN